MTEAAANHQDDDADLQRAIALSLGREPSIKKVPEIIVLDSDDDGDQDKIPRRGGENVLNPQMAAAAVAASSSAQVDLTDDDALNEAIRRSLSESRASQEILFSEAGSRDAVEAFDYDYEAFPDIHEMFVYYNNLYFDGILQTVSVEWSTSRMTLCAGVCHYMGRIGGCKIVLSEPILKYRPVSDLKNTLLHEMIHAFLFVTERNTDHDGHGPRFLAKGKQISTSTVPDMYRSVGGYKITVYHNFHDEVDLYRRHIWECNRCKRVIRRAMNRVPSEKDCMSYRKDESKRKPCRDSRCRWHAHERVCRGEFIKIAQPEKPSARGRQQAKRRGRAAKPSQSQKTLTLQDILRASSSEKSQKRE